MLKIKNNRPILSILICTIQGREKDFEYIYNRLNEQRINLFMKDSIEIIPLLDDCSMTVGEKRNKLYEKANGGHICSVDDDDDVPVYYLPRIIDELKRYPDVDAIGFLGIKTTNNRNITVFKHSCHSAKVSFDADEMMFDNPINHLNPVRAGIAKKHKFPHINNGEDQEWAKLIRPDLKRTTMIPEIMYHYRYNTETTVARKNEKR